MSIDPKHFIDFRNFIDRTNN